MFVGVTLGVGPAPDERTVLRFRHLLDLRVVQREGGWNVSLCPGDDGAGVAVSQRNRGLQFACPRPTNTGLQHTGGVSLADLKALAALFTQAAQLCAKTALVKLGHVAM
jgi:hypothetical protein